ncbi:MULTISPECIES: OprD family porin [Pseudomonas aeruginosa group]|uniref:OprD family porin n=1 Tax=Pseudomonas aeruginosa TaxID=287 RepID=A0ABD7K7Z5_PSEAI|nr:MULTISPECIES: OprD family porin [Pseudomonas aeruginosa group]KSC48740.1 porin [Pseudomonas paraeruginosa]KSL06478.1 porin [Pseudomonas aeruginosa]MBH8714527.1 OprD family porin [Pseudomonas aeruginosa]MBI8113174.1 OprD family porin [Pseudomonas aeruginosa]OKR59378.1 porin [Pseudomonas aeruginosa]
MHDLRHAVFAGLLAGTLCEGAAATAGAGGFIEDSELQFLARTYYFNRDYRDGPNNAGRNRFKPRSERNGYREETTQGLRLLFGSGYTPGNLGFGLDAHAMLGLQLDSGGGRTGTGNLPVGADGHPEHRYGKLGGALKLRHGETRLKYGQTSTSAPVFAASSNRTLTGMAYGLLLEDRTFDGLLLEGGRFSAASGPGESRMHGEISTVYGRLGAYPVRLDTVNFLGGQWQAGERLQLSLYAARFDDVWRQAYLGARYRQPLGEQRALLLDFNAYRTRDSGQSRFGRIDTLASSLALGYEQGPQRLTLAYQHVRGEQPFDYMAFGDGRSSASMVLANSLGYSDFNGPGERSWQLRYDLELGALGLPGLSLHALHARGRAGASADSAAESIYAGLYGRDGRHRETDLGLAYRVKAGPLAGLALRASQAWHRGNPTYLGGDVDETRLILDYPWTIW